MPPQKNANSSKNSLPVQDVPQIWPQMTDSFRQFTGIVLNKNFNIQSVLQQVLNSNKDESIDKNNINPFNLLLIYICSHCHEVGSGKVLQYILPILSSFSIERVINKIRLIEEI